MSELQTVTAEPATRAAAHSPLVAKNDRQTHTKKRGTPWYEKLACRCGIHSGKWNYVTEGNCKQLSVCARCGHLEARTRHHREWRYVSEGRCEEKKTCRRCGDMTRGRTSHNWGSTYKPASYHDNAHQCLRCGQVEEWDDSYDD